MQQPINENQQESQRIPIDSEKDMTTRREHRATGPRTTAGKQRSSRNSRKGGFFSKDILIPGESAAEYDSLLKGLLKEFQPQGTAEIDLVRELVWLHWRKRRLAHVERAEILDTIEFGPSDFRRRLLDEAVFLLRGETGGLLKHSGNPFILMEAIESLTEFRNQFEQSGFRKDRHNLLASVPNARSPEGRLEELYDAVHYMTDPGRIGVLEKYLKYEKLAMTNEMSSEDAPSRDELEREMLEIFDEEIRRLKRTKEMVDSLCERRDEYVFVAGLIPSGEAMERLIHYEAHIGRQYDRILNRLERLQRLRRGQSAPPTLNVEITG